MGGVFLVLFSLIQQTSSDDLISDATVLKPLSGKKIVYILPHDGFRDEEYIISRDMLENAGATIIVASSDTTMAKGMIKNKVKPDILIDSIHPGEYAALLFIGGVGARKYWDNKFLHAIADTAVRKKKVVGAICIAPIILARAGVLASCKATVWGDKETKDIFENESVIYTGRDVETSGTIVTASIPEVVKPWTEEIMRILLKGSMLQQKEMIDTKLPEPEK